MAETEYSLEFGNSGELYIWDNIDPDGAGEITPDFMTVKNYGNENEVLMKGAGEDANWQAAGIGGLGDVIGPAGATDNAIARWNTGTGKLLQDSDTTLSDDEDLTGLKDLTMSGDLTVDTNTLFVDAAAKRVGIGTLNPQDTLHVEEDTSPARIRIESTGADDAALHLVCPAGERGEIQTINQGTSVTVSRIVFPVTNQSIQFQTGGSTIAMSINSSQKVGIGTENPSILLDINEKSGHTSLGGVAVKLTNKTGGNTVAGQLVEVYSATAIDNAFKTAAANSDAVIGITYEAGIADGSEAWVVVSGRAEVLVDAGGCARGDRLISSSTAGSAIVWNTGGAVATHFQEIGHCLESRVGAGLSKIIPHFN